MKHFVTLLFFAAAIAAYIAGSMPGTAALLIVGVVFESLGWYRILRGKKRLPVEIH